MVRRLALLSVLLCSAAVSCGTVDPSRLGEPRPRGSSSFRLRAQRCYGAGLVRDPAFARAGELVLVWRVAPGDRAVDPRVVRDSYAGMTVGQGLTLARCVTGGLAGLDSGAVRKGRLRLVFRAAE